MACRILSNYFLRQGYRKLTSHHRIICRRGLLSESYSCHEAWEARLQTPILQKVEPGDFAIKLQDKLDREGSTSSIDIDILANKLEQIDFEQLEFVLNIFKRFRQTKDTVHVKDSTWHAIVRALLDHGETERLLEILQDKETYGIFLDYHAANLLLDHFIEEKQYKAAAQVAYDLMLQEELEHPLTRYLAWYACHLHWVNPEPEEPEIEEQEEEDEEKLIVVNYIRNPWYDDHFDISQDKLLLGKTFIAVSRERADDLGRSYHLIGCGLYEKFNKGLELLAQWIAQGIPHAISKHALDAFAESLSSVKTKEAPETPKDVGEVTVEDVMPYVTEEDRNKYLQQFTELRGQIEGTDQVTDLNLGFALNGDLNGIMAMCEAADIKEYKQTIEIWNTQRQKLLDGHMENLRKQKRKQEIADRLLELQAKAEKLSYFEQVDKINLGISRVPKEIPIEDVVEEEQFVLPPGERSRTF